MEVPDLLTDEEGGKLTLKQKVNQIISYLRHTQPEPEDIVTVETPVPVYDGPFSFEGFTSSPVPGFLNAPSGGYQDETGNHIIGIVKLDRVPLHVREAFQKHQAQG